MANLSKEWMEDCIEFRGEILTGKYGHWCFDWDDLPIDETCDEWPCCSYAEECMKGDPVVFKMLKDFWYDEETNHLHHH